MLSLLTTLGAYVITLQAPSLRIFTVLYCTYFYRIMNKGKFFVVFNEAPVQLACDIDYICPWLMVIYVVSLLLTMCRCHDMFIIKDKFHSGL